MRVVALYDAITRRSPGVRDRSPKRVGHNLPAQLRDYNTEMLRFTFDVAVPFTDTQAWQDIRMMKVKMKISGGFRTQAAAATFATLRIAPSTARKQRLPALSVCPGKQQTEKSVLF
jgi:transposase